MASIIPTLSISELACAVANVQSWKAFRDEVLWILDNPRADNLLNEILDGYSALDQFMLVDRTPESLRALADLQAEIDRKEKQLLGMIVD